MNEQYLWDRSGPRDPQTDRIETLLCEFSFDPARLDTVTPVRSRARRWWGPVSVAAAIALLSWAAWPAGVKPGWNVVIGSGQSPGTKTSRLYVGDWLRTDASTTATLVVADIGRVEVAPNSRVRLKETRSADASSHRPEHRIELAIGKINASISAPPRIFFVETPSAMAVDLGCVYELTVDDDGAGLLEVTFGQVELEGDGRYAFVPADALCRTLPGVGPGTPYFPGASERFLAALSAMDRGKGNDATLSTVLLESASPRDTLALWHLLSRVDPPARQRLFERITALVPDAATSVDPVQIRNLDHDALASLQVALKPAW